MVKCINYRVFSHLLFKKISLKSDNIKLYISIYCRFKMPRKYIKINSALVYLHSVKQKRIMDYQFQLCFMVCMGGM